MNPQISQIKRTIQTKAQRGIWMALHKKSAKPNKSEPEAVATGSPLIYEGDN
jgi:hypothetical protein